jgi:ElaB/YqjD/DUF883 family membrane-anchored ribosome-binding protein
MIAQNMHRRNTMDERSLRNTAASAADAAADQAANLSDSARAALDTGMRRARRAAESASDWAADAAGTVSDASVRGYRTAEDMIRIQPVLAVGAALVLGVVIGALLFSRDD